MAAASIAATVGVQLLVTGSLDENLLGNRWSKSGLANWLRDTFSNQQPQTPEVREEIARTYEERQFAQVNRSGEATPDLVEIDELLTEIRDLADVPYTLVLYVNSSDVWSTKPGFGLGQADDENTALMEQRTRNYREAFEARAVEIGVDISNVEVITEEHVYSSEEWKLVEELATTFGYEDIESAILAHRANPAGVPPLLRAELERRIDDHQGVRPDLQPASGRQQSLGQTKRPTENPLPPPIPIPIGYPLLAAGVARKLVARNTWVTIPGAPNTEWLHLYPNVFESDGTMKQMGNARRSEKFVAAVKEGRLEHRVGLDWTDSNGRPQTVDALFFDHVPNARQIAVYRRLLIRAAELEQARVDSGEPRALEEFHVFPSQNAGRDHGDVSRLGVGVGVQHGKEVQATAFPGLNLVEFQATEDPNFEELIGYLGTEYYATVALATIADTNAEQNELVAVSGAPGYYTLNPRFRRSGEQDLSDARRTRESGDPTRFDVVVTTLDAQGRPTTTTRVVEQNHPFMEVAHTRNRRGQYTPASSLDGPHRHLADAAATMLTGVQPPIDEARLLDDRTCIPASVHSSDTYGPSPRLRAVAARALHLDEPFDTPVRPANAKPVRDTFTFTSGRPDDHGPTHETLEWARNVQHPGAPKMVKVRAEVSREGDDLRPAAPWQDDQTAWRPSAIELSDDGGSPKHARPGREPSRRVNVQDGIRDSKPTLDGDNPTFRNGGSVLTPGSVGF